MTGLIKDFRDCAHQAGVICSIPEGKLIRALGLGDFLENDLQDSDDAPAIALKALAYFCEGLGPQNEEFKFAVLAVGLFLNSCHAKRKGVPQQALRDVVSLLKQSANESQLRQWMTAHFG
jgi:hypothetical protein